MELWPPSPTVSTHVLLEYSMLKMKNLLWCVSDRVIHQHEYVSRQGMMLADTGFDKWHWCWPDLVTRRGQEHAKSNIPLDRVSKGWREDFQKIRVRICLKVWPLLEFPQQHGRLAFQKLEALARSEDP